MEENKNIEPEQPPENIPEEINPATESILPEAETAATEQLQISNPKLQTQEMEVHHHGHVHEKKKWLEYIFQFFMLFFAVFCGFWAENYREHGIERHREEQYIQSMVNDLKTDTTKLGKNIAVYEKILLEQDTLKKKYPLLKTGFNKTFYKYLNSLTSYPDFIYTDGTILQLKNSGGFRLIMNSKAVDSIMVYDALVKKALINEATLGILSNKMDDARGQMFNQEKYDEAITAGKTIEQMEIEKMEFLLSHDNITLTKYYYNIRQYNWLTKIIKENIEELKLAAIRLINFLKKDYDLK